MYSDKMTWERSRGLEIGYVADWVSRVYLSEHVLYAEACLLAARNVTSIC